MFEIVYSESAYVDLKKLDINIAQRIIKKIAFFGDQKDPLHFSKPLKNLGNNRYRFRIGDYRAIFSTNNKGELVILNILRIKHRKDIYLD